MFHLLSKFYKIARFINLFWLIVRFIIANTVKWTWSCLPGSVVFRACAIKFVYGQLFVDCEESKHWPIDDDTHYIEQLCCYWTKYRCWPFCTWSVHSDKLLDTAPWIDRFCACVLCVCECVYVTSRETQAPALQLFVFQSWILVTKRTD